MNYYRVESGTMRCLVWETTPTKAVKKARRMRQWRALALLTRVQQRLESREWGPWLYVQTYPGVLNGVPMERIHKADAILSSR